MTIAQIREMWESMVLSICFFKGKSKSITPGHKAMNGVHVCQELCKMMWIKQLLQNRKN